jgi:hypothetical protein
MPMPSGGIPSGRIQAFGIVRPTAHNPAKLSDNRCKTEVLTRHDPSCWYPPGEEYGQQKDVIKMGGREGCNAGGEDRQKRAHSLSDLQSSNCYTLGLASLRYPLSG